VPKLINFRFPEGWYFLNDDNTEPKRSSNIFFSVYERHRWAVDSNTFPIQGAGKKSFKTLGFFFCHRKFKVTGSTITLKCWNGFKKVDMRKGLVPDLFNWPRSRRFVPGVGWIPMRGVGLQGVPGCARVCHVQIECQRAPILRIKGALKGEQTKHLRLEKGLMNWRRGCGFERFSGPFYTVWGEDTYYDWFRGHRGSTAWASRLISLLRFVVINCLQMVCARLFYRGLTSQRGITHRNVPWPSST